MEELERLNGATDSEVLEWAEKSLGWTRRQLRTHLVSSPEWGFNLDSNTNSAMVKFLGDMDNYEFLQVFMDLTKKTSEEFRKELIQFVLKQLKEREELTEKSGTGREVMFYCSPKGREKVKAELLKDALRINDIPFTEEIETDLEGKPELCIYVERIHRERADNIMRMAFSRYDIFRGWTLVLGVTSGICFIARWVFPEGAFVFTSLGIWSLLFTGVAYMAARTIGSTGRDLPRVDD